MAWIRAVRARLSASRHWAARTFLRPGSVTLYHRPAGWGDGEDAVR
ncbi:hypothetical protein [Sphingomonas sp. MMS24-J13]